MLSVLVVDESSETRRLVVRSLQLSGMPAHEVREAGNVSDALQLIRERCVDIVLCELHVPVMDGLELVRQMSGDATTAGVPVVILSSERRLGLLAELEQLGVRALVRKPFQPQVLGQLVREVLRLGQAS
jgi:two-component system, chemotaxis family, chemotaxis protein CheY